jgi:hypothetical protein
MANSSANNLGTPVPSEVIVEQHGATTAITGRVPGRVQHHTRGDGYSHPAVNGKPGKLIEQRLPNGTLIQTWRGE